MLKVVVAADFPAAVRAVVRAGIPVFAQFGITPQTAQHIGGIDLASTDIAAQMKDQLGREAKLLEESGAFILDFTHSGPVAGPAVTQAVSIPVIGGMGGGPWLDGRVRLVQTAIGSAATALDNDADRYTNVARAAFDAINAYADDVREGRQVKGG